MNVRFARTGARRVNQCTHHILADATYVMLGGIWKRSGEMYEAWDNDIDVPIGRSATVTEVQRQAREWYGDQSLRDRHAG